MTSHRLRRLARIPRRYEALPSFAGLRFIPARGAAAEQRRSKGLKTGSSARAIGDLFSWSVWRWLAPSLWLPFLA